MNLFIVIELKKKTIERDGMKPKVYFFTFRKFKGFSNEKFAQPFFFSGIDD